MKKMILAMTLCLASLGIARAQDHAIGIRIGGSVELLYQHELPQDNFLQFTVGIPDYDGISLTGTYNWHCCKWDWTPQTCDWHLDAGLGAQVGVYNFNRAGLLLGAVGSCSFGCQFKEAPVSIDLDYRPTVGIVVGGGASGFFKPGLWNFGVSIAYHF